MSSASSNIRVAVVGGGIGGVSATLALLDRGLDVQLYEKADKFGEYGAGLGFAPNSVRAMQICSPKVHGAFKEVANYPKPAPEGEQTVHFDLVDGMTSPPRGHVTQYWDGVSAGAHRGEFLEGMVHHLPAGVSHLNKALVSVDEGSIPTDPCTLHFADGTTATADVVLGYDGIGSHVRHHVIGGDDHPAARASYSHQYTYRMLVPMDKAKAAIGERLASTSTIFMGKGARVISLPISHGSQVSVAGLVVDAEPWPSSHKLILPATKDEAMRDFAHFSPEVRALLDNISPDHIDKWALYDLADHAPPQYARGRVCIAGDAAHATTPHLGVGAGFAIEDAAVLSELLAAAKARIAVGDKALRSIVEDALRAYEAVRLPRGHWLPPASRRSGLLMTYMVEGVGDDLEAMERERQKLGDIAWGGDVDAFVSEAKADFARRA